MRLLRLLFLLLLIPSVAFGWGTGNEAYQSVAVADAATCDTPTELYSLDTTAGNYNLSTYYTAAQFTVTADTIITSYKINIRDLGAGSSDTTCGIYVDAGSGISTSDLVSGTEVAISYNTNAWSMEEFTLSTEVTLTGTDYALYCLSGNASMLWGNNTTGGDTYQDSDGLPITGTTGADMSMALFGCAP